MSARTGASSRASSGSGSSTESSRAPRSPAARSKTSTSSIARRLSPNTCGRTRPRRTSSGTDGAAWTSGARSRAKGALSFPTVSAFCSGRSSYSSTFSRPACLRADSTSRAVSPSASCSRSLGPWACSISRCTRCATTSARRRPSTSRGWSTTRPTSSTCRSSRSLPSRPTPPNRRL